MTAFEERMAALRLRFRDRAVRDGAALARALADRDIETLRRTSHGLAGTAGIFGFHDVGAAAVRLEDAVDASEEWPTLETHCAALRHLLDTV